MRHFQAVVLVLTLGVIGCCLTGSSPKGTSVTALRAPTDTPAPAEVVFLDVAQVVRPRGDRFLNHELWEHGDEQGYLETKLLLEENGLRVCQIGGLLPPRLQALLASPQTCPDPRRLRADPEQPTPVLISPPRNACAFRVQHNGTSRSVALHDAQCFFEVVPRLTKDGQICLRFTPRLRHGPPHLQTEVARDPDGSLRWDVQARECVEDVPELTWEITVEPEEYVIVGARLGAGPDTLGCAYFLPEGKDGPTQKLLVLRALQLPGGAGLDEKLHQAPPLALQATWFEQWRRP